MRYRYVGSLGIGLIALTLAACGSRSGGTHPRGGANGGTASSKPSLDSCVSAWNRSSSSPDRQGINVVAAQGSPVVMVATYNGPTQTVGDGSGPDITVRPNTCIVIAAAFVYVEQSNGNWPRANVSLGGTFSSFADPTTSQQQANAQASVGIGGDPSVGLLTASPGASIVIVTPAQVSGTPGSSSAAETSTGGTSTTGTATGPTHSSGPSASETGCGAAPGGPNTSGNDTTLTVTAGPGVSCATAVAIIIKVGQDSPTQAQDTQSMSTMYYEVDGWHCNAFNMNTQDCEDGRLTITATTGS